MKSIFDIEDEFNECLIKSLVRKYLIKAFNTVNDVECELIDGFYEYEKGLFKSVDFDGDLDKWYIIMDYNDWNHDLFYISKLKDDPDKDNFATTILHDYVPRPNPKYIAPITLKYIINEFTR